MPYQSVSSMKQAGMRLKGSKDTSFLGQMLDGVEAFLPAYKETKEKKAKEEKDRIDKYTALRKAGYTSDEAIKAIESGSLGEGGSGADLEREGKLADIRYKDARSEYYEGGGSKSSKTKKVIAQKKIDNGEILDEDEYDLALDLAMDVPDASIPESKKRRRVPKKEEKEKVRRDFGAKGRAGGMLWLDEMVAKMTGRSHEPKDGDKRSRAADVIEKQLGKKASKAQIDMFLEKNPTF